MIYTVTKFEQQIKQMANDFAYIKQNLSQTDGPIFIELIGTPKSGKTSLLGQLEKAFQTSSVPLSTRQETAEYNPIENKEIEEYNIWMLMELMKNLSADLSDKTPRIIVYDRGILDRLPWLDLSKSMSEKDTAIIKQLYNTDFVQKYKPISYCFITSPEISIQRKGKPGRLVNTQTIEAFNKCFSKSIPMIKEHSSKVTIQETDAYQGKIKKFLMDMTERIVHDLSETIKEKQHEKRDERE